MDYVSKPGLLIIVSLISLFSIAVVAATVPSTHEIHVVSHNIRSDLLDFCKKTTNPALCAKTIEPHFHNGNLDPYKALEAEVEATLFQVKKTIAIIHNLLAQHDLSESVKGSLDTCKDQYASIMDSIHDTIDALSKKDVIEAKFKFSAVISFQSSCKDAFEGMADFPIAADSDTVFQLGGNCLDIIAAMEKALPQPDAPAVQSAPSEYSNVIGPVS